MADANEHLAGHRERLRQRFVESGPSGLLPHEKLELLLFGVILRRDVKPIARALLARFGSVSGVLGAPLEALLQTEGVGEAVAVHLKAVQAVMVQADRDELKDRPLIGSWSTLLRYLKRDLGHERREKFRVLFLDPRHMLVADETLGEGTVDHAPVYPREIARRALELSASSVVLVHNHPSGDPAPSAADIAMTRAIIQALKPLSVSVHDHVIVGRDGTSSLKAMGLI